ncbi:hypothetical protein KKB40_06455 [Patescibacteria group bacterium]|nr:hypothetical protein [Patescibacteria group bacterium]
MMKKTFTGILLLSSSFFLYLFFPKQIFGITNPALTTTNPALPGGGEDFFSNLLSTLITALLIFGVIFFVFVLAFGAIKWITAGGDKGAIQQAKEKVTHGLIGAVILLSLFAIYGTIGCFLGIGPCSEDIGGGVVPLPPPQPTVSPIAECPSGEACVCSEDDLDCGESPYKICSAPGSCTRVECTEGLCCICSLVPPPTPTLDPSLPTPTPVCLGMCTCPSAPITCGPSFLIQCLGLGSCDSPACPGTGHCCSCVPCNGCIDASSATCQPGTSNTACGSDGNPCQNCATSGLECIDNSCQ